LRTTEITAMSETGNLNEALTTLLHPPGRAHTTKRVRHETGDPPQWDVAFRQFKADTHAVLHRRDTRGLHFAVDGHGTREAAASLAWSEDRVGFRKSAEF
jgi:hypothetical protein